MHPFAAYIRILGRGKHGTCHLSQAEARTAMGMLLRGEADPLQIGAFLMLLRVKEECAEEVAGFVEAARAACQRPDTPIAVRIDWPSYAGKRRQSPWFLLAALALAQAGYRIFMHGSAGHTPDRLYTETALRALGLPICADWSDVAYELDRHGLAYLPLQAFCPALEQLIHLKPVLGLRSIANSLVRLLNPLDAPLLASSIFHPAYGPLHQQALALLGTREAITFKGDGGEIEIRPEADTRLYCIQNGQPVMHTWPRIITARSSADAFPTLDNLCAVWRGRPTSAHAEACILHTMAVLLFACREASQQTDALTLAEQLWANRRP